ncbi:MAG: CHC2 zinc finger domain-containing protein [Candidatus Auribacterota bacterium]
MDIEKIREQLKECNPIEDVISEFIHVDNNKAKCPFHEDKTPSLSINIDGQYFHCFGCGVGGDVFSFIMQYKNCNYLEASQFLAQRTGIIIPTINQKTKTLYDDKKRRLYSTLQKVSFEYHNALPEKVRSYLNKRKILDETINKYKIGFCDDSVCLSESKEALMEAGLMDSAGKPFLKGHISFPHFYRGEVVYITGRGFPDKSHRKLKKDKVPLEYLFNQDALHRKEVIIAEGEIDTLTLLQNGFNACGVLGTASFKREWVDRFKYCETVYLAFDNDPAGRKASESVGELMEDKIRIVVLPEGQDINDFFETKTKEDFQTLLNQSQSLLEFQISAIDPDTPRTKLKTVLDPFLVRISKLSDPEITAILKHIIKDHFKFDVEELKSYEKLIKQLKKKHKTVSSGQQKYPDQHEIMELLKNERNIKRFHPAQDYANGLMNFAIILENKPFVIFSDKRTVSLNELSKASHLQSEYVSNSRFSPDGVLDFIESDKEIDISALFEKVHSHIMRFILFHNPLHSLFLALWIMGTYLFMVFRYFPYVWLNAEKGSGKTLLMEVLAGIAFNGELVTNPTESVIFRDVSDNLITMFIDEVEQFRKRDKETFGSLITILNTGFSKSSVVKRIEKNAENRFVPQKYYAYSPKMFAGINEIDDVLQDRTVRIRLLRKKDAETVDRYKETEELQQLKKEIRDELYIFALQMGPQIAELYQTDEKPVGAEHLSNRDLDIWEPIFILANVIDLQRNSSDLTNAMVTLSKESLEDKQTMNVEQNETYKILFVLSGMLDELDPVDRKNEIFIYTASDVLTYFQGTEEYAWVVKSHSLTRILKKVDISSAQNRDDDGKKIRVYNINRQKIEDLFERYNINNF